MRPRVPGPVVVTGATSGIGRATAQVLAESGRQVIAVGRSEQALDELRQQVLDRIVSIKLDLDSDSEIAAFATNLSASGDVSALIHCAGVYFAGDLSATPLEQFDSMYRINVRSCLQLTQKLLPGLCAARGDVIFVNSSAGISARPGVGAYSSSKHAVRAIADALRAEVGQHGVRVLSIFLGRTATPMMEKIVRQQGGDYKPKLLLQAGDIGELIRYALEMPRHVEMTEIHLRPAARSY